MTESLAADTRTRLRDVLIVDADVHIDDHPAALAPYCDMPWRRSLELQGTLPQRYLSAAGYSPQLGLDPPFPGGLNARHTSTAAQMRDILISCLDGSKLFILTENQEHADAVIERSGRRHGLH